jgi:predicted  nucleic acid-binding Zn-ribbon protein
MSLEQLFQKVECGIYHLGQHFLRDHPGRQLHDEAERLSEELQQSHAALGRHRRDLDPVGERIVAQERQALILESRVEAAVSGGDQRKAWNDALELDRLRQTLAADRTEVCRLETAIRRHQERIVGLERQLAAVQQKLYPG